MSALSQDSYANADTPITFLGTLTANAFANAAYVNIPISGTATSIQVVNEAVCLLDSATASGNVIDLTNLVDSGCKFAKIFIGTITAATSTTTEVIVSYTLSTFPPNPTSGQGDQNTVQAFAVWTFNDTINQTHPPNVCNLTVTVPLVVSSPKLYLYISSSDATPIWGYTFSESYIQGML